VSTNAGRAGVNEPRRLQPSDHPEKAVREALEQIVASGGWYIVELGHWGQLRCTSPCKCKIRIDHSPEVPSRHAKRITREAARCPLPLDSAYRKPQGGVSRE
jgi:hypothetical protein